MSSHDVVKAVFERWTDLQLAIEHNMCDAADPVGLYEMFIDETVVIADSRHATVSLVVVTKMCDAFNVISEEETIMSVACTVAAILADNDRQEALNDYCGKIKRAGGVAQSRRDEVDESEDEEESEGEEDKKKDNKKKELDIDEDGFILPSGKQQWKFRL
ncbi:hypothetical protein ACOME3_005371 [Neoechinorhynchus agilis]